MWFGASETTFPYADTYMKIYTAGTFFALMSLGLNYFINCQGFSTIGMATVLVGAVTNIILDPVFIFVFDMGVAGAAIATVIAQILSCLFALFFLFGKRPPVKISFGGYSAGIMLRIVAIGLSPFLILATDSVIMIVMNTVLQKTGGTSADMLIAAATIVQSYMMLITGPLGGISGGTQAIISFNYGAGKYSRVKQGIKFMSVICIGYTTVVWILTMLVPGAFIAIFNGSGELMEAGVHAMRIYFFGFCFMSLQFSGQTVFTGLGKAKQAIFFSLLRKAVIVVPLTLILPHVADLGVNGVFLAEPISNFIGGTACFVTMLCIMWPALSREKA